MTNYIVDILILIIILLFIFIFASKGLVGSIMKSFSWLISIMATYFLYPIVSGIIRHTFIFDALKDSIYGIMGLENVESVGRADQIGAIDALMLPNGLKNMLVDNNNPVIYELLGVDSLQEYIAGYIANIILNIITGILVFFIILCIIKITSGTLRIAVKMPVVRQINGIGGALLGFFWGIMAVWTIMAISTLFITAPFFTDMINAINTSFIGSILYDNNIIMNVLLAKLFGWG